MTRTLAVAAGIALLTACQDGQVATDASGPFQPRALASQSSGADVNAELAALRRVTAAFHNFQSGSDAGWSAQITPCMTDPGGAGGDSVKGTRARGDDAEMRRHAAIRVNFV